MDKEKLYEILERFIDSEYELDCFIKIMSDLEEYYFLNCDYEIGDKVHFINKRLNDCRDSFCESMKILDEYILTITE